VAGTTAPEDADAEPVPALFVAETVNVYEVPFERPVTVQLVVEVVQVNEPGVDVTVYPVVGLPPVEAGATHDTAACAFPDTADTDLGTPGVVAGTTTPDASDA
jgi:hypothetical protein